MIELIKHDIGDDVLITDFFDNKTPIKSKTSMIIISKKGVKDRRYFDLTLCKQQHDFTDENILDMEIN